MKLVIQDEWLYFPSLVCIDTPSNPFGSSSSSSDTTLCLVVLGAERT